MDPTFAHSLDAVGQRLKSLRLRRGATLTELATATGISASTLSRLEAGLRRPTLEQLLPLTGYYGVTLDYLVDAPRTANPLVDLRPIPCGDGSVVVPLSTRPGGLKAFKFVLSRAPEHQEPTLRSHDGYDWAYVLSGTLRLVLGDQDLLLKPGEAAEFDTRTPHWFGATSSGPVEYLSLIGKHGEQAHIRASQPPQPRGATL